MSDMWWSLGPYKKPRIVPVRSNTPVTYYNPQCKHEHTSWDIVHCAECIKYTGERNGNIGNTASEKSAGAIGETP